MGGKRIPESSFSAIFFLHTGKFGTLCKEMVLPWKVIGVHFLSVVHSTESAVILYDRDTFMSTSRWNNFSEVWFSSKFFLKLWKSLFPPKKRYLFFLGKRRKKASLPLPDQSTVKRRSSRAKDHCRSPPPSSMLYFYFCALLSSFFLLFFPISLPCPYHLSPPTKSPPGPLVQQSSPPSRTIAYLPSGADPTPFPPLPSLPSPPPREKLQNRCLNRAGGGDHSVPRISFFFFLPFSPSTKGSSGAFLEGRRRRELPSFLLPSLAVAVSRFSSLLIRKREEGSFRRDGFFAPSPPLPSTRALYGKGSRRKRRSRSLPWKIIIKGEEEEEMGKRLCFGGEKADSNLGRVLLHPFLGERGKRPGRTKC